MSETNNKAIERLTEEREASIRDYYGTGEDPVSCYVPPAVAEMRQVLAEQGLLRVMP